MLNSRRLVAALSLALASFTAAAAPVFTFSFADDAADNIFGRNHVAGTVTGNIYGLAENGANLLPTAIEITSGVAFLGMSDALIDGNNSLNFWNPTGFTVVNGVITSASLGLNFLDPAAGSMQFRLNGEGFNVLHWNGGSGPLSGTGNQNGFSGATYALAGAPATVPEPTSLALVALALAGGALATRRCRTA